MNKSNQCVLPVHTNEVETLTVSQQTNKIQIIQTKMKRSMLEITRTVRIPERTFRNRAGVRDAAVETILHLKSNWARHVAWMPYGRWTKRVVEGTPWYDAYRQRERWTNNKKRVVENWGRIAQNRHRWQELREAFIQQWI